jgi:uncharacterized protein (TIGR03086 family)
MTNTTTHNPQELTPQGDADPRVGLASAIALGGEAIARVDPVQLGRPTPCTDFAVRDLLGHMVFVLRRVAAVGRGDDAFAVAPTSHVADTGWVEAWTEAAHQVEVAWADAGVLQRIMVLPFGELPGAAVATFYTGELTIHTWDLATATEQRPAWDDGIVASTLFAFERFLPPTRAPEVPFDPPVSISGDRPLIERLVAWTGRRP